MLELRNATFHIEKDGKEHPLLENVTLRVPTGHFMAIVGPSGCGKSTLLKLVAGINQETDGSVHWQGRDLSEEDDFEFSEIGYVPQFGIAYESLTVEESVASSIRLRAKTRRRKRFRALLDRVLASTGLAGIRDRPVRVLSGGQRRRLSLALELVTDPALLLCDEVTSGLDPRSEREIVELMHQLSRADHRIVVNVTHSLAGLDLYDSVLVLHEGRVVYHGPPRAIEHYFAVEDAEALYAKLDSRTVEGWARSWDKHRGSYYAQIEGAEKAGPPSPKNGQGPPRPAGATGPDLPDSSADREDDEGPDDPGAPGTETTHAPAETPGPVAQFFALFFRRWKLLYRDTGQLVLQLAILLGFPFLVILFDLDGVDQLQRLSESLPGTLAEFEKEREAATFNLNLGGLVSGLVMFQVILLTLMGSNNSAREIAGERSIFEKEKLGGLRPSVYLASKVAFLSVLVCVQSCWMAGFVQLVCRLPMELFSQHLALLLLVNAAMTAVCLAISSLAKTADQASLLSIYLVGFQLPLSGAVLALPPFIGWLTRPFISAYWSWAGSMDTLQGGYLRYVRETTETWLAPFAVAAAVLVVHLLAGLVLAYIGVKRPRWEE